MHKEAIAKFAEVIHLASEANLSSTLSFISLHKEFLQKNPQYANQMYFRCLELFIKNSELRSSDIKGIFPEIIIEDPFSVNGDFVDYSTVTNALVVCNILKNHPYFENKFIVRDNPLPRFKGDDVICHIEKTFPSEIEQAIKQTNQKTPDYSIQFSGDKRLYDLKMTKSTSYTGQRVGPLEYTDFMTKFEKNYITEILGHIKGLKNKAKANDVLHKNLLNIELKIKSIAYDINISTIQKNQIIHEVMLKTEYYPSELRISIIYPTDVKPFLPTVSEKIIDRIPLPTEKNNNVDDSGLLRGLKAGIGGYGNATLKKAAKMPGINPKLQQFLDSDDL